MIGEAYICMQHKQHEKWSDFGYSIKPLPNMSSEVYVVRDIQSDEKAIEIVIVQIIIICVDLYNYTKLR